MRRILFFVSLVLILCCACEEPAHPQQKTPAAPGQLGSTLPAFATKDLNGHNLTSEDFKGKVVIVDFWATWCAPCRKEMPGYQALVDKYGSQGLHVIGFKADVMEDTEDPIQFLRETGVRYPISVGSEEIRKKFGGLQGLPTTYIYDRQGILRYKVIGFEYTDVIERTIKPLL